MIGVVNIVFILCIQLLLEDSLKLEERDYFSAAYPLNNDIQ